MISLLSIVVLTYIVLMMGINFAILGYILRKEYLNRRAVLFLLSIILYMGVESISLGYIIFYHGSPFIEPVVLLLASVPIIMSAIIKSEVIRVRSNKLSAFLLAFSIVFDEIAMGYLYASAFGPHMFNPFIDAVSNIAFGIMMLADGVFFLLISRVKSIIEFSLTTFAISMAFLPSIFIESGKLTELVVSFISTIIMIINIVTLYLIEIRRVTLQGQLFSITLAFFDFLMMLGLTTFASFNDMWLISLSIVLSMIWYFILIFYEIPSRKIEMKLRYPFIFLVFVNLAELTMGFGESVLGFTISNSLFSSMQSHMMMKHGMIMMRSPFTNPLWWLFPINPIGMGLMFIHTNINIILKAIFTSYMFVMATTMTPFYVIMMGAEMSYLVYERYKHAKNLGVKRWALVILLGIPIFVVLIPYYTNFYIFGMSGMIFPVTLLPFIISLLAVVIASTLFGRRAYCNAVCMSAHMWTNIFYDQFKPKKSSKVWEYLRWVFVIPIVIAFSLYILMEIHLWTPPKIGMTTLDPLNFYGMFVLNYIWWIFYFLTPVFGAYSCARQGWCGFGTFAGIFNKVFFKIKANEVETCKSCEVKACDSSCPVKIPISQDVITKGYSNRISCVGCGDCVEACPYNNLEIIDITNYLSKKSHIAS
ncbi:4Fe-4S binding protein [Sulfurisphaera tokodaii]|uniref:4Fe-4S ferredoxin-type domain-containing protein n=2 Tax=Sulfurisphaera tokodaii TaxID=111955 RepID=Q96ZZ0_SULTO|nr:4Fe-4S binding protein [Sulfurisphaera tokodaii]BAB66783.1 hypothetical protein STK_17010 [Sulfurisphaera tokodaii str. 7]HII73121.1 4Fe-4S binding protein [Sulfurisphaera tokodaii]